MKVTIRLLGFGLLLAAAFGVAAVAGSSVDVKRGHSTHHADQMSAMNSMSAMSSDTHSHAASSTSSMSGMAMSVGGLPQGLSVEEENVRLVPATTTFPLGRTADYRFRILDGHGRVVRDFQVEHAKKLHLIVVRRDFAFYQHVHPTMAADGTWSIPLRLGAAGVYRVFADFQASGAENTILATDLFVAGDFQPQAVPAPVTRTTVDGYDVALRGAPRAGSEGMLEFTVTRAGQPVKVQPYLDADGHLVALRQGDLAYLHVHPQEKPGHGGPIVFMAEYPSVGTYRLFLQFKAAGAIHTAEFTQEVR